MRIKILPFIFCACFLFLACTQEVTTIRVKRNPTIKFNTDSASWVANKYFFTGPSRVIVYPSSTATSGQLYYRYTLQAFGVDSKGNNLQLVMALDAADSTQLIGTYTPSYTLTKGLAQVQLFNLNNLSAYTLCNSNGAVVDILRQSLSEEIVAGNFNIRLCNVQDTTLKMNLSNGLFTDITY